MDSITHSLRRDKKLLPERFAVNMFVQGKFAVVHAGAAPKTGAARRRNAAKRRRRVHLWTSIRLYADTATARRAFDPRASTRGKFA